MSQKWVLILGAVAVIVFLYIFDLETHYFYAEDTDVRNEVPFPTPTAAAWALFKVDTGEVVEGRNLDEVRPIASITKLFSAYAVLETNSADRAALVEWWDYNTEGRAGKLELGETFTLGQLLFPLLIESSNDAGTLVGRTLGDEYSVSVTRLLKMLNLTETTIVDASGLSPANVSTARELALVYSYMDANYEYITNVTQLRMYIGDNVGYVNNNPGRTFDSFRGGKQGFLYESGRTFVGAFELTDGSERGVVLLNSHDIVEDLTEILTYLNQGS